MKTFLIIIISLYTIYYAINIFYDIFLKKEKNIEDGDNREEFTMNTVNIEIDQVEEITTSSKMEVDENNIFSFEKEDNSNPSGLEKMKRKFEEEEELEKNYSTENEIRTEADDAENAGGEKINKIEDEVRKMKKELIEKTKKDFSNILALAETKVQVVRINGEKIFKSNLT